MSERPLTSVLHLQVTTVGKVWTGYQLEVTAIDPLADAYAELYLGVVPPSRPMKVDGERLTSACVPCS
jgi:hypothetical protein